MKVKNFTNLWFSLLLVVGAMGFATQSYSQLAQPLACNDNVQISLNQLCEGVTPDMLLEDAISMAIHVNVTGADGQTASGTAPQFSGEFQNADGTPFDWGAYVGQTVQYTIIETSGGNTCWGTATIELNLLPELESPCVYVPGDVVVLTDEIGPEISPTVGTPFSSFPLTITEECQDIVVTMDYNFKWNCGTHTAPDWCEAGAIIGLYDADGVLQQGYFFDAEPGVPLSGFTISANSMALGDYTVQIAAVNGVDSEGNAVDPANAEGSVSVVFNYSVCTGGCFTYCSEDETQAYPEEFVTVAEIYDMVERGCFADIEGDIIVVKDKTGDSCGGITVVEYYANINRHGTVEKILLLSQAFETHPFAFANVNMPISTDVDCSVGDYSPAGRAALYGDSRFGFPYIIDTHSPTYSEQTVCPEAPVLTHVEIPVDTVDQMVPFDTDGDGIDDAWVLLPVVIKELVEEYVCPVDSVVQLVQDPPRIIPIVGKYCNIIATYSDTEFSACGGGKKVFRQWQLLDWCNNETPVTTEFPQVFEVIDLQAPVIDPLDDVIASIEPWTCSAKVALPAISASDNCGTNDVTWVVSEGRVEGDYLVDLWLGAGPIEVIAVVRDDCDNAARDTFNIAILDQVKPVPVCQDELRVTLTTGGEAKILAESFDAGSHDAGCGDVDIYVRRKDGCCGDECAEVEVCVERHPKTGECTGTELMPVGDAYGDYVKFCCEDAGQSIPVELLVVDAAGNENVCWVLVTVEDKSNAQCYIADATIGCLDDIHDTDITGYPSVSAVCNSVPMVYEDLGNVDGCGEGVVQRCWYFDTDGSGDVSEGDTPGCCQTIYINNVGSFNPYTIKWPKHYDDQVVAGLNVECEDLDEDELIETGEVAYYDANVAMGSSFTCVPDDVGGKPAWCETNCGLIGYSVEVDTITASDACLKIVKRWTVIDWCTWEANGGDVDDENDTDNDQFVAIEDWAQGVCVDCGVGNNGPVYDDAVYFKYTEVDVDGYYTYDQVIKVIDDQAPTIDGPTEYSVNTTGGNLTKDDDIACTGTDTVSASAEDFCAGESSGSELLNWVIVRYENGDYAAQKTATGATASMGTGEGEPGDVHVIKWTVIDGCGNQSTAETEVTFGDLKAPTPFCISGLTTAVMPIGGTVAVWAKDFDFGSFDNCSSYDELTFALVRDGETPIMPGEEGFGTQTGITYTCEELGNSNVDILNMWVFDSSGNGDFCTVQILIEDNENVCDGESLGSRAVIAGETATEFGDMIDEVRVSVNTNLPEYPATMLTGNDGQYAFASNPMGLSYEISAEKDIDYMNGVSTLDLVLIQKHILGIDLLDSPYKVIAADINNDENVSAVDLVELRKLILGIYTELPANNSWRFVDATETFNDVLSPFPFSEKLGIGNLTQDMMSEDFVGVKIGDVSGNAAANNLQSVNTRTNGTLSLNLEDANVTAGETVRVSINSEDFNEVYGYQFTLNHTGLSLLTVESGVIAVDDTNVGVRAGQLTMSYGNVNAVSTSETLFTLVFKADADLSLSQTLNINSSVTRAEAYTGSGLDRQGLALTFRTDAGNIANFELGQNEPNPFGGSTVINFTLPESGQATLTVFDVAGKVLTTKVADYNKGLNQISLSKDELRTSGVVYYQLESGEFTATKKMIVIE